MQVIRAGGQRACIWKHGLRGGAFGSGRCEQHEPFHHVCDTSALMRGNSSGHTEVLSHWVHLEGLSSSSTSCNRYLAEAVHLSSVACSPLQFSLDDLRPSLPSGQTARAFQRAVCVPFQSAMPAPFRAGLERKVRQLLMEMLLHAGPLDLHEMMLHLARHGLCAAIAHPAKPQSHAALFTRSINAPFLVVTSGDSEEVVVVDTALREHLAVAPSTPAYQRMLAATVPEVFIGTRSRLDQLVMSMASAISLNFASQGVDLPPWRRTRALLSRWSVLQEHERLQQRQPMNVTPAAMAGASPAVAPPQPAGIEVMAPAASPAFLRIQEQKVQCWVTSRAADDRQVVARDAGVEGKVHGGCAASHHPIMVVRGFEVGEGAGEQTLRKAREMWPDAKPGGLACLRQQRQASSVPGSSTESEEVWGASPASVFRDD